jgi:hypothetical protein
VKTALTTFGLRGILVRGWGIGEGWGREMLNPFGPGQLVLAAIYPADTPSLGMVTDSLLQRTCQKKISGPQPEFMHTRAEPQNIQASELSPAPSCATRCTVP